MLKCCGVKSRGIYTMPNYYFVIPYMLEAFTLHLGFKSKLKWMPCLLLSLLPLIAEEECDVLGASLRDFFIVYAFIRT